MKKFYLSTKSERTLGVAFTAVIIPAMVAMLLLLDNLTMLLIAGAGVALVSVGLIYYAVNVVKTAVVALPEEKKLRVEGIRNYEIDLTNAVRLETIPVKNSQSVSRALAFTDAKGEVVGVVPTLFTSRQGVEAEPTAIELAQVLGLDFKANVPKWEYDEEARKIHEEEVARQQKEDAKTRREAKMKLRIAKEKNRKQMEETFKSKK